MYAWPPNPGFTVIISTWSTMSRIFSTIETGVWGLRATDGLPPKVRIRVSIRWRWSHASTCTITTPVPHSTLWYLDIFVEHRFTWILGYHQLSLKGNTAIFTTSLNHFRTKGQVWHSFHPSHQTGCRSTPEASSSFTHCPMFAQSAGRTLGMICMVRKLESFWGTAELPSSATGVIVRGRLEDVRPRLHAGR